MTDHVFSKGACTLVFVYNARSDLFSRAADFAHKFISPHTYSCGLCNLTHGHFGMHREWAHFIQNLPVQVRFLYKDQAEDRPQEDLPQVWLYRKVDQIVLIGADELNALPSLSALMDLIGRRLRENEQE